MCPAREERARGSGGGRRGSEQGGKGGRARGPAGQRMWSQRQGWTSLPQHSPRSCSLPPSATMTAPTVAKQDFDALFGAVQEVSIAGKTALITGCSAGIGKATACALAAAGVNLVLVARRADRLEELRAEIAQRFPALTVDVVPGNVSDPQLYADIEQKGLVAKVDFLIANAGLARGKDAVGAANLSDWNEMMDANCMGTFRMANLLIPAMAAKGGGHVVATGSIAGLEPYEGGSVYCASKHALHAFMKSLRRVEIWGRDSAASGHLIRASAELMHRRAPLLPGTRRTRRTCAAPPSRPASSARARSSPRSAPTVAAAPGHRQLLL